MVKVITLHEPWASFIVPFKLKRFETRSTPPAGSSVPSRAEHGLSIPRMPGLALNPGERVAIHAAKRQPDTADFEEWHVNGPRASINRWDQEYTMTLGAIIGSARFVSAAPMIDLHTGEPEELMGISPNVHLEADRLTLSHHFESPARHIDISSELAFGDWAAGRWAWELDDVIALERPIPATGGRGVWAWKDGTPEQLTALGFAA